jgi:hypothetical protein
MRSLVMPKKEYRLDGRCVFCLQDMRDYPERDVTDEHIIPDAIRGNFVILDGACRTCAELSNNSYENRALNTDFHVPRRLFDLRSQKRRGKKAKPPRPLPPVAIGDATMDPNAKFDKQKDVDQYPPGIALIGYPPPGLLSGVDRGSTLTQVTIQIFNLGNWKGKASNVTQNIQMINGPFAMAVAKIGYCYAVAERGFEAFDGDAIRLLLAGKRDDVYNFVGNTSQPEALSNRHLHALYIRERGDWLTVLVHLFASCNGNPEKPSIPYEVVVGKKQ